jgi:CHAT domain-containing protein
VRSFASFYQGSSPNLKELSAGLAPLPETAEELRLVSRALGAAESEIHLGAEATEAAVKGANLARYGVVYFATHGLVAGEVKGLAEPALALTLPEIANDVDDGLLTASEVAQLKLNADWVVLSACNTAAGERPGAEALSGLARAFFYAGARAILVSHWQLDSNAAVRLTTATFKALQQQPNIGRAEALRLAMLGYLSDGSNPWNAYPDYWAAFSLIGEGGGAR